MKKVFLLLSAGVLLVACNSGYQQDGPDQANANKTTTEDKSIDPLKLDSAAGTNVAAVNNQMQVDTNSAKIGTSKSSEPASRNTIATGSIVRGFNAPESPVSMM